MLKQPGATTTSRLIQQWRMTTHWRQRLWWRMLCKRVVACVRLTSSISWLGQSVGQITLSIGIDAQATTLSNKLQQQHCLYHQKYVLDFDIIDQHQSTASSDGTGSDAVRDSTLARTNTDCQYGAFTARSSIGAVATALWMTVWCKCDCLLG